MSATQLAAYGLHADVHAFILRPVQAHTACNLFGRAVAARLLIYPGNLFGLAHAAEMARHCSSFPGTVISSPGTIAGFGAVAVHSRDHAHGHKYFDTDAFFQGKMAVGHGGLLLAAWLLLLPIPPKSRPGLLPLHAPTMWCVWNENLSPQDGTTDTRGHNGSLQLLREINLSLTG